MLVFDKNLDLVFSNAHADEMFGWEHDEKVGMKCGDFLECIHRHNEPEICGETASCPACSINQALRHAFWEDSFSCLNRGETTVKTDNGTEPIHLSFRVNSIMLDNRKYAILALYDITEQKEAERVLKAAAEERRQLLREMNHRVKNNLGLVSALIDLKQEEMKGKADLTDIRNQVLTIGLLHEKLSSTEGVKTINPAPYITDLLKSVFSLYPGKKVAVTTDIEIGNLPTKTAVVCGLILNELATNAMKYGFKDHEAPRFEVGFFPEGEKDFTLRIANSGGPLLEAEPGSNPESMGLMLVQILVEQLKGSMELEREPAPVFTIRFPRE